MSTTNYTATILVNGEHADVDIRTLSASRLRELQQDAGTNGDSALYAACAEILGASTTAQYVVYGYDPETGTPCTPDLDDGTMFAVDIQRTQDDEVDYEAIGDCFASEDEAKAAAVTHAGRDLEWLDEYVAGGFVAISERLEVLR